MMQHFRLRNAVGRPASVASRAAQSRWKKDMCSATTVVAPPPLSNDANTKTEQGVRCDTPRRRAEWRPSEAHKASATSLRRNEVWSGCESFFFACWMDASLFGSMVCLEHRTRHVLAELCMPRSVLMGRCWLREGRRLCEIFAR